MQKIYTRLILGLLLLCGPLTAAAQVNLVTTISATPNPVNSGVSVTLSVGIANTGATNASNIVRRVVGLPTGLTGVTFGGTNAADASYNSALGEVTFNPTRNLNSGANRNFTIIFPAPTVNTNTTYPIQSRLYASNGPANSDATAVTATVNLTVNAPADVTTTLTGPTALTQGIPSGNYTVTYTNNGPATASTVTRTVTLPTGATGIVAPGGSIAGTTITYPALATQASGGTASFTFSFTPGATGGNVTSNTSTATGQGADTGPNSATVAVTVSQPANVATTLTGATTAAAGAAVTYTITSLNGGPATANGVVPQVALTPFAGLVVTATNQGQYNPATGIVAWPAVNLANGASVVYSLTFQMPASGSVSGVASSTAITGDPTPGNNDGSAAGAQVTTAQGTPSADVQVSLGGPATVSPGAQIRYSALAYNAGTSPAAGVSLVLTLPAGTTGLTATGGGVVSGGNVVTWTVGTLAANASSAFTVSFNGPAASGGTTNGSLVASATTADPASGNNTATLTTTASSNVSALQCGNPGADGNVTISAPTVVNTYFPGTSVNGANTQITVGGAPAGYGATSIAAGDLVLVIQMQGASINSTNADTYGDNQAGDPGQGVLTAGLTAGQYEYRVVQSVAGFSLAGGGAINFATALTNTYTNADATTASGQVRFQVIRIPQYRNLTLNTPTLTVPAWNGRVGGVIALDVAQDLAFGGNTINAAGAGFRGGAGRVLAGGAGASTDYRTSNAITTNASKGEGIVGTPRYVNNGGVLLDTQPSLLPLAVPNGYPNGDYGRGAPGNAGGGGTDGNPGANDENTGGGGGSNVGFGGKGGNAWQSSRTTGGFGGALFTPAAPSRLVLGGGGGAGTTNNGTFAAAGFASSGAAGGGIVIIRAATVSGSGTINANGAAASSNIGNDGSGGGGAGGSVVVSTTSSLGNLTITVQGGQGGSNTGNSDPAGTNAGTQSGPHGPGGGGSGGVVYVTSSVNAASSLTPGTNGSTRNIDNTTTQAYGASTGTSVLGASRYDLTRAELPNLLGGADCVADVATSITPSINPAISGQSLTLTVPFANLGIGAAAGFVRSITGLPAGLGTVTITSTQGSGTYNNADGTVSFTGTPASVAGGANADVTIVIASVPNGLASISLTSTTSTTTTEYVNGNNTASLTIPVTAVADVTTAISGPASVGAGQPTGNFTATFTNNGPSQAASVTQTVTLPVGSTVTAGQLTTIQTAYPAATYNAGTRVLDFGTATTLNSGSTNTFIFAYTAPTTTGSVSTSSNVGTATSQGPDVAPNTASTNTTITAVADVTTGISGPASVGAGQPTGNFTATFTNNGPSQAASVTQTVTLPATSTLTAGQLATIVAAYPAATYNAGTRVLDFGTAATLNSGSTNTFVFAYTSPTTTGSVSTTTNVGTATSQGIDAAPNTASATTNITAVADVTTGISGPATIGAGQPTGNFTATFTNNGPSTATSVTQTVTLPATATLTAGQLATIVAAYPAATYNAGTRVLNFGTAATLNSGATNTFVFAYTSPTTTGSVSTTTNVGTATSQGVDAAPNTASATTNITAVADVTVTLTGQTQIIPSSAVTFTATYTNNGPSVASTVTRTVTLPVGATMTPAQIAALPGGATYTAGTRVIDFGPIASQGTGAGNASAVTFTFTSPASAGSSTLTANVGTATSQGPNAAADVATLTLNVAGAPFTCNSAFLRVTQPGTTSNLERLDRTAVSSTSLTYTSVVLYNTGVALNALAFNYQDGYLYAFGVGTNRLYRLSQTAAQDLGSITALSAAGFNAATSDLNGNIYLANNNTTSLFRFNVSSLTVTPLTLSQAVNFGDMGFNPVDGNIYASRFYPGGIYRIDMNTAGATRPVTTLGTPGGSGEDVGSIFFDAAGKMYAATNQGTLAVYSTSTGVVTSVGSASSAAQSDGASCVFPTEEIDVVLSAATPVRINATTFDVPFTVRVRNTGAVSDPNVQINEFLSQTFPTATSTTVSGLTVTGGTGLTANGAFNGQTDTRMLTGTLPLASNATATITYTVRVTFPAGSVPTTTQFDQVYVSSTAGSPNNGWVLVNGALVPPTLVLAGEPSTNSTTPPATPNGDVISPTPINFSQPLANNDAVTTPANTPITFPPAANDVVAVSGNTLVATTIDLDPTTAGQQTTLIVSGGTFTLITTGINAGQVTFTPVNAAFTGVATGTYTIQDNAGNLSNVATLTVTVTAVADVTTAISGPATVGAGQPTGNFTATFTNNGPSQAANVTQTVTLPAGSSLTAAQLATIVAAYPGTTYNAGTQVLNFGTATTLNSGSTNTFVFAYTAPITAGTVSTTTNTATATSQGADVAPNTASATTTILAAPVANADNSTTTPGTPVTFSITANDTDADGTIAPATVVLTGSAIGTPGQLTDANGNTFLVNAAGNLTFTPAPGFVGVATATYTVQDNSGLTSNPAVIRVVVQAPSTDVATVITAPANGATVPAGDPLTFTIQTTNNGPATAYAVSQTAQFPANLAVATTLVNGQTGTLAGSTVTYPDGSTYSTLTGLVTFPTLATQANGATTTNTVTIAAPASGPLSVAAHVTQNGADTNAANNTATVNLNIDPRFDLLTTISGPTTTVAGNQATFTVITTNNSTSTSPGNNVVQTVQLPAGLVQVFVTNNGLYDVATGVVTFPAVNDLTPGQSVVNTISFDAPATGFTASATVTPNTLPTGDTNPANNTASATPTVVVSATPGSANVGTRISAAALSVAPGAAITLTIVSANYGPATAANVAQQVQLPTGLTFTSLGGGSYDSNTGVLSFPSLATLATAATQTYTVSFNAPAAGPVLAAASVSSTTADPVPSNNFSSIRINVTPTADVATSLTGPVTAVAGELITYTVGASNLGGLAAADVVQTVQLAPGLSGVVVSGGGTYNATTGVVTFPTITSLAIGTAPLNTITFTAPADLTTLNVIARVSSTTPDGVLTNNVASASTVLASSADVAIAISGPATAVLNSPVTYTVTTTNNGPSPAASIAPTIQLPPNLTLVNLPAGATYLASTGVLTLATLTNLPSGSGSTTAFTLVMPAGSALVPQAAANVTAATNDRNLTNNAATTTTAIAAPTAQTADMQAAVVANAGTVTVDAQVTFTATFTNNGTGTAANVAPRMTLAPGLTVGTVSNGGTYNSTTGVVTWPVVASLNPATPLTYTVAVTAPAAGPLVATAIVASSTSDEVPANNTASTSVTITPLADVTTSVSGPASALPGETVTYQIRTRNSGPSAAANVQTTITLPVGATNVVLPAGASQVGNVVTLPLDAVQPAGGNSDRLYQITFDAPNVASWTVDANVSTATTETNTGNNASSATSSRTNRPPVARNIVNASIEPIGATAGPRGISSLVATDADGTVASYTVAALPSAAQGVLYINGVELNTTNFPGLVLTPLQASQLQFDPAPGFTGNVFFNYTATDNLGAVSTPALYTLPIGRDTNSLYTANPPKGAPGTPNPYQVGDVVATVFDPNGGRYTAGPAVNDTGTRNVVLAPGSNAIPAGMTLNPTTGEITVTNPSLLTAGTTVVDITTIDVFGGTNTQPVAITITNTTLPVELTRFTARRRQSDAVLAWATASERNSAFFAVERSRDNGRTFTEVGRRKGAGTTSAAQEYTLTDAGVGRTAGTVLYRLRQVDTDGTTTLSDIRTVTFTDQTRADVVTLLPNPFTDAITVNLTNVADGQYTLTVVDMAGRTVLSATQAGGTSARLDTQHLPTGTYVVRVSGAADSDFTPTATRLVKN